MRILCLLFLCIRKLSYKCVAGVVIPFIIEYIEEKYVFLIYAIEGVVCTLLFLFLKETRGKEREDNIKEIEEEIKKEIEKEKEKNDEKKE